MGTINRPDRRVLPPLVAGQQLDQPTFHERYAAMPPGTRAELIGGVVSMPSPLGWDHAERDEVVGYWLSRYRRFTRGLRGGPNATTILGNNSELQPDRQLCIPAELGGQTHIVEGFVGGAPELVVEVSKSSRRIDLGMKKDDYERAGVLEYIVVALDPDEIFWFVRRDDRFARTEPGVDGWYRSEVFPGLRLDDRALFAEDYDALDATQDRGIASPEHAEFVARLAAAARPESE